MNRKRCTILGVGVAAAGIAVALAGSLAAGPAVDVHTQWNTLASAYFSQVYFVFNPTSGSYAGLHQYDRMLEDYSRAGIDRKVEAYKRFEKRVDEFNAAGLSQEEVADREIALSNI